MSDDRTLVIKRVFDAPCERVFAAWIDPEQGPRWWGPKGCTTVSNAMDVRVGGAWRRVMRGPGGTEHQSSGVYPRDRAAGTSDLHLSLGAWWRRGAWA